MADATPDDAVAPMLAGVRVLDLTQYYAGPSSTRLLAELGADVIHVELAPDGDPARTLPTIPVPGRSGYYVQQNRGKRSLCVGWQHPEAWEVLADLAGRVDVVVENFGTGVLDKRGLDHATLRARYPKLIYVSVSAFGRTGPYADKVGYDQVAQATSGMMHLTGERNGPPMFVGSPIADASAGVHAFGAVGHALFHRERTGRGQYVDLAMVDCLYHMHSIAVQAYSLTEGAYDQVRSGAHSDAIAPVGTFKGPEGWIVVLALERQWGRLCAAMGRPDLEHDTRFATSPARRDHRSELVAIIEAWMAGHDTDAAVLAELEAQRVPCAPVLSPTDAFTDPHLTHREMVRRVPDRVLGEVAVPGFPFKFSDWRDDPTLQAPLLGEHNAAVLGELCGYDDARIAALVEAGVLHSAAI